LVPRPTPRLRRGGGSHRAMEDTVDNPTLILGRGGKAMTVAVVALLLGFDVVQARTSKEVEIDFFDDADLTNEVGFQLLPCNGGIVRQGKRTQFYVRTETKCDIGAFPPPPPIDCNFTQEGCKPFLPLPGR